MAIWQRYLKLFDPVPVASANDEPGLARLLLRLAERTIWTGLLMSALVSVVVFCSKVRWDEPGRIVVGDLTTDACSLVWRGELSDDVDLNAVSPLKPLWELVQDQTAAGTSDPEVEMGIAMLLSRWSGMHAESEQTEKAWEAAAIEFACRAVDRDPDNLELRRNLVFGFGTLPLNSKTDPQLAQRVLQTLRAAVAVDKDNAYPRYVLAWACWDVGCEPVFFADSEFTTSKVVDRALFEEGWNHFKQAQQMPVCVQPTPHAFFLQGANHLQHSRPRAAELAWRGLYWANPFYGFRGVLFRFGNSEIDKGNLAGALEIADEMDRFANRLTHETALIAAAIRRRADQLRERVVSLSPKLLPDWSGPRGFDRMTIKARDQASQMMVKRLETGGNPQSLSEAAWSMAAGVVGAALVVFGAVCWLWSRTAGGEVAGRYSLWQHIAVVAITGAAMAMTQAVQVNERSSEIGQALRQLNIRLPLSDSYAHLWLARMGLWIVERGPIWWVGCSLMLVGVVCFATRRTLLVEGYSPVKTSVRAMGTQCVLFGCALLIVFGLTATRTFPNADRWYRAQLYQLSPQCEEDFQRDFAAVLADPDFQKLYGPDAAVVEPE